MFTDFKYYDFFRRLKIPLTTLQKKQNVLYARVTLSWIIPKLIWRNIFVSLHMEFKRFKINFIVITYVSKN
jgi:hypothetical protein